MSIDQVTEIVRPLYLVKMSLMKAPLSASQLVSQNNFFFVKQLIGFLQNLI